MKTLLPILFTILYLNTGYAQTRYASIFTDHMVLQRNSQVLIWGWANSGGQTIEIKTSWNNQSYQTQSNSFAKWEIEIPTPKAGGPYEITLNESQILKDILIGEVWLCSGQSNMQWNALNGIDNSAEAIKGATNNQIRFYSVPRMATNDPQVHCEGSWSVCSPETMPTFSAVAYFFGKELQEELNVPIGLIHSSWGGTSAETWTPASVINADPDFANWENRFEDNAYRPRDASVLYNAMIHPLVPFDIAGVIWYQGESNAVNPFVYRRLFPAMIESWRASWKKDFPFYYVQIAPFKYNETLVGALVREAQLMTMKLDKVGMTVINDIGNVDDIHPRNKHDVGKRLAYWALKNDYNQELICSGPIYKSVETRKNVMVVHFDYGEGLYFKGLKPQDFYIAGADGFFYPAEVRIEKNTLVVSHPKIKKPAALRYAFSNAATGNLFNAANLPASSFRTDDWPVILDKVEIVITKDEDEINVALTAAATVDEIRFTLDGSMPGPDSKIYKTPFLVKEGTLVKARAVVNSKFSEAIAQKEFVLNEATFSPVFLENIYHANYPSSGENALTDGFKGSTIFNDGNWQGFEGNDLKATIDLGKVKKLNKIRTHFLQDQGAWIFLPKVVKILVSTDNINFTEIGSSSFSMQKSTDTATQKVEFNVGLQDVRYIRVEAINAGQCPDWHPGKGGATWIFVDEVEAE